MSSSITANAPGAAQGAAGANPTRLEAMSPRELLEFGTSMALQFDDEVRMSINGMQETADAARRLSELRQQIHDLSLQHSNTYTDRNDKLTVEGEAFQALDPEARELLGAKPGDTELKLTRDMLDQADTKLELQQNQINSGQETRMMAIQESMRQRSELVQLLSNILREHGETNKAIVRNIQ